MFQLTWSAREKKVARRAFDAALDAALETTLADFRRRAAAAAEPDDLWEIERYLRQQRRALDQLFDYRYSQLPFVFARLIHEGLLDESRLAGLDDEKLEIVRSCLSALERR